MRGQDIPGATEELALPCGERVRPREFDLGTRAHDCACGETHAVVTDTDALARFVPPAVVDTLRAVVETDDAFDQFGIAHVMSMVQEEFPDQVVRADCTDDGAVGYALVWVCALAPQELHRVVVELLVELMDHAVGHAENEAAASEFDAQLSAFDVEDFVDAYREQRDASDR